MPMDDFYPTVDQSGNPPDAGNIFLFYRPPIKLLLSVFRYIKTPVDRLQAMESPSTGSRIPWKAIHIPYNQKASPHSTQSLFSAGSSQFLPDASFLTPTVLLQPVQPQYEFVKPRTSSSTYTPWTTIANLRELEAAIRTQVTGLVASRAVPNLQQIALVSLSCTVLVNAVVDALCVGVDQETLPVHFLVSILKEFRRLVHDILSHDLMWKISNASACRAELDGLMLPLLFQELNGIAKRHVAFLGPQLKSHHIRVQENLFRWEPMLQLAMAIDKEELGGMIRNCLTPQERMAILESALPIGNTDVLEAL